MKMCKHNTKKINPPEGDKTYGSVTNFMKTMKENLLKNERQNRGFS